MSRACISSRYACGKKWWVLLCTEESAMAGTLSYEGIKYSLLQGLQSLSIKDVLDVGGVSQLGVCVLYAVVAIMLLSRYARILMNRNAEHH